MNPRAISFRLCLAFGALVAFVGCQAVSDHGRYAVTAMKAPFYKYGPAQAFGADFALVRGQHLTMVERGFGFSRVLTEDGVSGFISTDDIAPAPEPVPQPQPRVASRRGGASSGGGSGLGARRKPAVQPEFDAGLFNVNDIPLPTDSESSKKPEVQPPKPDARPQSTPEPTPDTKPAAKPKSKKSRS